MMMMHWLRVRSTGKWKKVCASRCVEIKLNSTYLSQIAPPPHILLTNLLVIYLILIGRNRGGTGSNPSDFGMEGLWGLYEILLYPIMYRNIRNFKKDI